MSSSTVSPKQKHVSPASQVTPEQMEVYRAAARRRAEQGLSPEAEARRQRALAAARRAAAVLKEEFSATRVVVFGSVAHGEWFTERSDINLAVWGITLEFFRAWAEAEKVISGFKLELIDIREASEGTKFEIKHGGIELCRTE